MPDCLTLVSILRSQGAQSFHPFAFLCAFTGEPYKPYFKRNTFTYVGIGITCVVQTTSFVPVRVCQVAGQQGWFGGGVDLTPFCKTARMLFICEGLSPRKPSFWFHRIRVEPINIAIGFGSMLLSQSFIQSHLS